MCKQPCCCMLTCVSSKHVQHTLSNTDCGGGVISASVRAASSVSMLWMLKALLVLTGCCAVGATALCGCKAACQNEAKKGLYGLQCSAGL